MLEYLVQLKPEDLVNKNQLKKEVSTFKDNIILIDLSPELLLLDIDDLSIDDFKSYINIQNINKKSILEEDEEKIIDSSFNEITQEMNKFPLFKSLQNYLNNIKIVHPLEYNSKIFNLLSSANLLRFNIQRNDKEYSIDVMSNNGNCIGGSTGQKSWILGISYGSIGTKLSQISFIQDKLLNPVKIDKLYNKYQSETLNLNQIKETLKSLSENENFKACLINIFNHLVIDEKSTNLYFINYFGLNNYNYFDIEHIQEKLLDYYINNPKIAVSLNSENMSSCRICGIKENITKNNNYSLDYNHDTHVFNLSKDINFESKKYINMSAVFCESCSDKISLINNKITEHKASFIKIGHNNFTEKISTYNQMSDIHRKGYEDINNSVFFHIEKDDLSKSNNLKKVVSIKSKSLQEKELMFINFNLIQYLYSYTEFKKDDKYSDNWLDNYYKDYPKDTTGVIIYRNIKNNFSSLRNFWIDNKKIDIKIIDKILQQMLSTNKAKDKKGFMYFYNMFSCIETKNDIDNYILSIYEKITLKKGREPMFNRHIRINEELSKLDNVKDELSEIELYLDNDDFWVLVGRVIGYLNSKSKSDEKRNEYLNKFRQTNKKNILTILNNSFFKYGYSVNDNQVKFKLIYSYILENIDYKIVDDNTFNNLMSGALNGKIIKLTKTKEI